MYKKYRRVFLAFTRPELLVAFIIIGIIIAMIIPNLISDIQSLQHKITNMIADNGGAIVRLGVDGNNKDVVKQFKPYSSPSNNIYENTTGTGNRYTPFPYISNGNIQDMDSIVSSILNDRSLITYKINESECISNIIQTRLSPGKTVRECVINVDLNGYKEPNVLGKDIIEIHVPLNSILQADSSGNGLSVMNSYNYSSTNRNSIKDFLNN